MALWPWMEGARLAPSCCNADGSSASSLMFFRSPGGSQLMRLSASVSCGALINIVAAGMARNLLCSCKERVGDERTSSEGAQCGVGRELVHMIGHQSRLEVARHGALHVKAGKDF